MEGDGKKITVPAHVCHPAVSPSLMKMAHRVSTPRKKITHYEDILIRRSVAKAGAEAEVKLVCVWKCFIV